MALFGLLVLLATLALNVGAFLAARRLMAVRAGAPSAWLPFRSVQEPSFAHWARPAVALAGPVAVYLCASAAFAVGLWIEGDFRRESLVNVVPGRPADLAGMKSGDRVTRIDGVGVETWDQLSDAVRRGGDSVRVVVNRGGEEITLEVVALDHKIGVNAGPARSVPIGIGRAGLRGLAGPARIWIDTFQALTRTYEGELAGPAAIVREVAEAEPRPFVAMLLAAVGGMSSFYLWPLSAIVSLIAAAT